ncbi:hypothetical protein NDU88_004312 [Pleurodeles waltl]|uniref:Uncharacterized protein n=1 Tax=Pleurodeles waltl TaxID=8319 RepID=A0AAV7NJ15_PLEWA|nr:hypothetical protein NDU88_004312 [Pleurodeles waltl]
MRRSPHHALGTGRSAARAPRTTRTVKTKRPVPSDTYIHKDPSLEPPLLSAMDLTSNSTSPLPQNLPPSVTNLASLLLSSDCPSDELRALPSDSDPSLGSFDIEQRVSDLEDVRVTVQPSLAKCQADLLDLQIRLDDAENRSRRSNLRFTGVPEGRENGQTVTDLVTGLIQRYVLLEPTDKHSDITIMLAHRVPAVQPPNSKYPRTILVNFGDFRIKEQILQQAIKTKIFQIPGDYAFKIFSDMSVAVAHRRRELKGMNPAFQKAGAQSGLVQQSKLKVFFHGHSNFIHTVDAAKSLLHVIQNSEPSGRTKVGAGRGRKNVIREWQGDILDYEDDDTVRKCRFFSIVPTTHVQVICTLVPLQSVA